MGPILGATVITDSLERVLPAYAAIGLKPTQAADWGALPDEAEDPRLGRSLWLTVDGAAPWLRLLEVPDAAVSPRFGRSGWFSLEVATNDVQRLADRVLAAPGFEHLGGPAPLEISEHIVAMQVAGPCGEIYYFTEVQRPLPPFDLYQPVRVLDRLFIAVCTVRSRADTLAFWSQLTGTAGLSFETRITVINGGLGLPADHNLPVATMQLAAGSLIEIDQLPTASLVPLSPGSGPSQGIAQISIAGHSQGHLVGPNGESVEICRLDLDQGFDQ